MKRRLLASVGLSFIVIIILSSISFADSDLHISRWLVDAKLIENGDLEISEDISFDFTSDYARAYRHIVLSKTDGVKDLSVSEVRSGKEVLYKEVEKARNGDRNKFTLEEKKQDIEIEIFPSSENQSKTLRLKYTIKNVAVRHSDTAELYYRFLGEENESPIDYFSVNLTLPDFEKDNINIFTHGPKEGKIYFSDSIIKSEIRDLEPGQSLENRILFPDEYIFLSEKLGGKSFNEIREEEESISEKFERDLEAKAKRKIFFSKASIYLSVLGIFLFIFYKFRRSS